MFYRRLPFTISADKHASYPEAFAISVAEKVLPAESPPVRGERITFGITRGPIQHS